MIEIGLVIFILWLWFGGAKAIFQLWQIYNQRSEEKANLIGFVTDITLDPLNYIQLFRKSYKLKDKDKDK